LPFIVMSVVKGGFMSRGKLKGMKVGTLVESDYLSAKQRPGRGGGGERLMASCGIFVFPGGKVKEGVTLREPFSSYGSIRKGSIVWGGGGGGWGGRGFVKKKKKENRKGVELGWITAIRRYRTE